MFRRNKVKTPIYKKDGYFIKLAGVCDAESFGDWYKDNDEKMLVYKSNKNECILYSDSIFYMKKNGCVVGYFIVKKAINLEKQHTLNYGDFFIKLLDFGIDSKSVKKDSKVLINYLINYAKKIGCHAIEVKTNEDFKPFYHFITSNYKAKTYNDGLYILVQNPNKISGERYFKPLEGDAITFHDLSFLYNLNFKVFKNKCVLKLNESKIISVNRLTGEIEFPSNVKTDLKLTVNNTTKQLIYLVIMNFFMNNHSDIVVNDETRNLGIDAKLDECAVIFNNLNKIYPDKELCRKLANAGYKTIIPKFISYDWENETWCDSYIELKIEKILKQ